MSVCVWMMGWRLCGCAGQGVGEGAGVGEGVASGVEEV